MFSFLFPITWFKSQLETDAAYETNQTELLIKTKQPLHYKTEHPQTENIENKLTGLLFKQLRYKANK